MLDSMERWVQRDGRMVSFGNMVGPFVGKPYTYECKTEEQAIRFEEYVKRRDPDNEKIPIAVGKEAASRFGAVELREQAK